MCQKGRRFRPCRVVFFFCCLLTGVDDAFTCFMRCVVTVSLCARGTDYFVRIWSMLYLLVILASLLVWSSCYRPLLLVWLSCYPLVLLVCIYCDPRLRSPAGLLVAVVLFVRLFVCACLFCLLLCMSAPLLACFGGCSFLFVRLVCFY